MSNAAWWERAVKVLPGGVNSPVRSFKSVPGDPLFFRKAAGSRFTDEDGDSYIDWCLSWGPLILGHADPDVHAAAAAAMAEGASFGAPSRREVLLAEAFLGRLPHFDQVRFVSSGTEAVMSAVRLARGFTGRDVIVKFTGCYHGHADHLLVDAGSGLATFGTPSSGGVPAGFTATTAVLPLDDVEGLREFFAVHGKEIAAVIVEPFPANSGLLIQRPEFMQACRDLTREHGALLIFDEVITGFRVAAGGAAEVLGITPDMGTYGKIIGGGFPVGAYATSEEIMSHISPLGPVYQAGTLSGNPVAMAAGLATLEKTGRPGFYEDLERKGALLQDGLTRAASDAGVTATVVRQGSLFWTVFQDTAPRSFTAIDPAGMETYGRLHRALIERGVYLAPSGWEVGFVSAAHSDEDIAATVAAVAETFRSWS
ncbi:glutamate-1-semialdehyde-2,1-aminomutase [bacterium CG17_big_fil_post_rev_8_21_14_2_50_64_8]|nr:MAG: glutamate-1-semialdehyde-2,1-aminomutase [bacterium CG17_big_fil_post_rev_8_21_14_2_50_64_8]PJA76792.1 MAG: glutamate-1-semialdehyde-2,1-aminomutase [bacterium CG_4_9_14_3_um_filter_65_15]